MIEISVITGFLGSGKTTLLRQLLSRPEMGRTAVIMNEIGDIGIDHELIEMSNESFVQLTTGCLCCQIRSDLVETLVELNRRRSTNGLDFERVVIETTGLAEPAPILQALITDGDLAGAYILGNVVATADATNVFGTMTSYSECMRQLVVADKILITKPDLVDDGSIARVRAGLKELNPTAECFVAASGNIDPRDLFDSSPFHIPQERPDLREQRRQFEGLRLHEHKTRSFTLTRKRSIHAVTLSLFLQALTENCGSQMLRVKGLVRIAEAPERPAVVQGVQHVFSPLEWLEKWPSEDHSCRLVFIVKDVSEHWVATLLDLLEAEVDDEAGRSANVA